MFFVISKLYITTGFKFVVVRIKFDKAFTNYSKYSKDKKSRIYLYVIKKDRWGSLKVVLCPLLVGKIRQYGLESQEVRYLKLKSKYQMQAQNWTRT